MHKRLFGLLGVVLLTILTGACTRVGPGYAGIKVSMAGDHKGVDQNAATTGWVFYNPMLTSVYEYPTFVQTAVWTKDPGEGHPANEEITFTTKDKMQVSIDVSLAYTLDFAKVPAFYTMFRSDDLEKFTHGFLRNIAREKFDSIAGKYEIGQIMGDNGPFLGEVRSHLQAALDPIGVQLQQFGLISAPRPPQSVIDSINATAQAQQHALKIQNEVASAEAEGRKSVATAEAEARAAIAAAEGKAKSTLLWAEAEASANKKIADFPDAQFHRTPADRQVGRGAPLHDAPGRHGAVHHD
jgi:regulator of protease activity HflC (stomatin/prohibitin superfamily)